MTKSSKFDNLSNEELRIMIERKREIESMPREELIAELRSADLFETSDAQQTGGLDIYPNSRLSALTVGPDEIIQAEFKTLPIWVWIVTAIFGSTIIWLVLYGP